MTRWEPTTLGSAVSIVSGNSPAFYRASSQGAFPYIKVGDLGQTEKFIKTSARFADLDVGIINPSHLGSIDKPSVCQLVKEVLEGGDTAFLKRQEEYGF